MPDTMGIQRAVQGAGTPGAPRGGVLTVQGTATGTPIPVSFSGGGGGGSSVDVTDRAGRLLGHVTVDASALPIGATTEATLAAAAGAAGAGPPSIPGSGIIGYLRAIYDRLATGLGRSWTLGSGTDSVTTVPSGTQAVSGAVDVTDRAGRLVGHVAVDSAPTTSVTADGGGGLATQATLAEIATDTDNLDATLSSRATEATLATRAREAGGNLDVIAAATAAIATHQTDGTQKTQVVGTVPLPTNAAQETGGHLASLDAKDFATQTTLAAIRAKTDNLDALTSSRTKPSDQQHVIADSGTVTSNIGTTGGLALDASVGTDGTAPPSIPGTGVRGWLRSIYDKLVSGLTVSWAGSPSVDVSDRAARLLGHTAVDSSVLPMGAATEATLAARAADATLTGGLQKSIMRGGAKGATTAADVTSTAEGADHQAADVQLYHGGVAKDPTAIRALTSADVVTGAQGAPNTAANGWPAKITDGTNIAAVKAASTAVAAADPALAVGLSPNSPLPAGANALGSVTVTGVATEATLAKSNNDFATLFGLRPTATSQEVRTATVGADFYHLRAPAGTLTSASTWEGVKFFGGAGGLTPSRVVYLATGVTAATPNTVTWP